MEGFGKLRTTGVILLWSIIIMISCRGAGFPREDREPSLHTLHFVKCPNTEEILQRITVPGMNGSLTYCIYTHFQTTLGNSVFQLQTFSAILLLT